MNLKRGKHIEHKYHLIRKIVSQGDIVVTNISSARNLANPFTNTLPQQIFESYKSQIHEQLELGANGRLWSVKMS